MFEHPEMRVSNLEPERRKELFQALSGVETLNPKAVTRAKVDPSEREQRAERDEEIILRALEECQTEEELADVFEEGLSRIGFWTWTGPLLGGDPEIEGLVEKSVELGDRAVAVIKSANDKRRQLLEGIK